MAENSKIEWTHHTANLWWGCSVVHAGCDNCYAAALSHRYNHDLWGNDKPRKMIKSFYNDLDKYQKAAKAAGEMHRVFVGSMMDIFEKSMPVIGSKGEALTNVTTGDMRSSFFAAISSGRFPNLMFLLLTKRETNINKMIPESWLVNPPINVMYGASVVDQETFDRVTKNLMQVKGRKFLSVEPQLDVIKLGYLKGVDWIIQGGESGPHKRPFNILWADLMRRQAEILKIPYFFKQIDKIQPIPVRLLTREFPSVYVQ